MPEERRVFGDEPYLGCRYWTRDDDGSVLWCDLDPVTAHHDEKVIDGEVFQTDLEQGSLLT